MLKSVFSFIINNLEILFWSFALISLSYTDPQQVHFSLCPLNNLGITWCPGCGFGHSVSFLLHGNLIRSVETHPLGIAGFIIIIARLFNIINFKRLLHTYKTR